MKKTAKQGPATTKPSIKAVDIIELVKTRCGVEVSRRPMSSLIAGTLTVEGKAPCISLNEHLSGVYGRVATAIILDTVLREGDLINVIVEFNDGTLPELTERARALLMPEALFKRAYEEKQSYGALRPSLLAATFQVPLGEVFKRVVDLGLYKA